jgi:acid phosphatase
MLFSGDDQGVIDDNLPPGTPWSTPNLGAALVNAGLTFVGYSEDLPVVGSLVESSGAYVRKHSPWINWQGTGLNQIPFQCNQSMNEFPVDFNDLPDLSFVIPNMNNDMHNGSDPYRISTADDWIEQHLKPYIDWAQTNNSLFILTFDEDNSAGVNQILCLFNGPMVMNGDYFLNGYDHFDLLRTLEDMYGLPYAGYSAFADPIEEVWRMNAVGLAGFNANAGNEACIFPNPLTGDSRMILGDNKIGERGTLNLQFFDISGRMVSDEKLELIPGQTQYAFRKEMLKPGVYFFSLLDGEERLSSGRIVNE